MSKKREATKAFVDDSEDDDSRSGAPLPTTKPPAAAKYSIGGVFEDSDDEPTTRPSAGGDKTLRPPPPPRGVNKKLRPLRLADDDDDDDDSSSDKEEVVRGSSSTNRETANKVSLGLEEEDSDEDDDLALLQQESKMPISQVKAAYTKRMLDNLFGEEDSDDDDDSDYHEPTTSTTNKPPPSALRFTLDKKTPNQNLSCMEQLLPGLFADIADYCWIQDLHSLAATSKHVHLAVKNLKWKCQQCSTGLLFTTAARLDTTAAGNCTKCQKRLCAHCVYTEERRVQNDGCFDCGKRYGYRHGYCEDCNKLSQTEDDAVFFNCHRCHTLYCREGECGNSGDGKSKCNAQDCSNTLCGNCSNIGYESGFAPNCCSIEGCLNSSGWNGYCSGCADTHLIDHESNTDICYGSENGDWYGSLCMEFHRPRLTCSGPCGRSLCVNCEVQPECQRCNRLALHLEPRPEISCWCAYEGKWRPNWVDGFIIRRPQGSSWTRKQPPLCLTCWKEELENET